MDVFGIFGDCFLRLDSASDFWPKRYQAIPSRPSKHEAFSLANMSRPIWHRIEHKGRQCIRTRNVQLLPWRPREDSGDVWHRWQSHFQKFVTDFVGSLIPLCRTTGSEEPDRRGLAVQLTTAVTCLQQTTMNCACWIIASGGGPRFGDGGIWHARACSSLNLPHPVQTYRTCTSRAINLPTCAFPAGPWREGKSIRAQTVVHAHDEDDQDLGNARESNAKKPFPDTDEILRQIAETNMDVGEQQVISQYEQLAMGVDPELMNEFASLVDPEVHVMVLTKTSEQVEQVLEHLSLMKVRIPPDSASRECLVLVRCADPYFGETKGETPPLHMMLVPSRGASEWLRLSLEKLPAPLREVVKYVPAEYVETHADCESALDSAELVVSHVITADWTRASKVGGMDSVLLNHYRKCTGEGSMQGFSVWKAATQPSVFKVLEFFASHEQFKLYMADSDTVLGEKILRFRAAVNRVRQTHQVLPFQRN
ncbi:hypothetical protein FVE85_8957 [Porphyridium purpureum]|uniref:Uncharacterized protein n=1 Tax=Porphyridium purpureum TaxID=35688 RepID=A0A5J4YG78_PORPP|nr:hypothetical protein FVE85_8957 [Porphyridium purpureum]|eukprot:POR5340..scf226_27